MTQILRKAVGFCESYMHFAKMKKKEEKISENGTYRIWLSSLIL